MDMNLISILVGLSTHLKSILEDGKALEQALAEKAPIEQHVHDILTKIDALIQDIDGALGNG